MKKIIVAVVAMFLIASCGGSDANNNVKSANDTIVPEQHSDDVKSPDRSTAENEVEPPLVITSVTRKDLDAILKRGPANILAMVQTDSYKQNGRFAGFRIVAFRFNVSEVLGLRAGDVLTRVNGLKIETPDQYFEVFERLKKAASIKFDIIRDDKPQTIENKILP